MKSTWSLICLTIIVSLLVSCSHFHTETFLRSNPLYYTDLIAQDAEEWELWVWRETERSLRKSYPIALFQGICEVELNLMLPPKTVRYHAFNYNNVMSAYNREKNFVMYPIGNIQALFHEYIHARNSMFSEECLSELVAYSLTKTWSNEISKEAIKKARLRHEIRRAMMTRR